MLSYLSPGVYVHEVPSGQEPIVGIGTSTAAFIAIVPDTIMIPVKNPEYDQTKPAIPEAREPKKEVAEGKPDETAKKKAAKVSANSNSPFKLEEFRPPAAGEVRLITDIRMFISLFGDFSNDEGHSHLAHAVKGFFGNGGTRCYVVREKSKAEILSSAIRKMEAIDEISIVVAPGSTDDTIRNAVIDHCENMGDRFAILDCEETAESDDDGFFNPDKLNPPRRSNYAAYYITWFKVLDQATIIQKPESDGKKYIPPSGHIAGVYARVDAESGVHKAPANEVVRGVENLRYRLSKADQDGLNNIGCNCIRYINGRISVWGARTAGGDANGEWKYINVRRLFLYLRESIDQGTQWVVFEPNTPDLWLKITRNVTAFLHVVWCNGALFGSTPEEAFYVQCNAETNPPKVRDLGQVVTEIGVAVVRPAEFVVFKISQWQGAGE